MWGGSKEMATHTILSSPYGMHLSVWQGSKQMATHITLSPNGMHVSVQVHVLGDSQNVPLGTATTEFHCSYFSAT